MILQSMQQKSKMMKIALVIIISFSGQLVSSANYLSFLTPATYSTATSCDDCADHVSLPSPLQFGSSCYTDAYVSIYSMHYN